MVEIGLAQCLTQFRSMLTKRPASHSSVFPENIFQILITDRKLDQSDLGSEFLRNTQSLKDVYPHANYRLYSDEEIQDFIKDSFPLDVLQAYRSLVPHAFKADLARYCFLYQHGGLYSDISYLHLRPISCKSETELVVFRDIPFEHPSWAVSNAIIYARPKSKILERAISEIVKHAHTEYHGLHPLEPTGPYLFGRVLAETENWQSVEFGDSHLINKDATGRANIVKIMPSGEIIAIRNKTANSSIEDLVSTGGNNYFKLWHRREVWRKGEV